MFWLLIVACFLLPAKSYGAELDVDWGFDISEYCECLRKEELKRLEQERNKHRANWCVEHGFKLDDEREWIFGWEGHIITVSSCTIPFLISYGNDNRYLIGKREDGVLVWMDFDNDNFCKEYEEGVANEQAYKDSNIDNPDNGVILLTPEQVKQSPQ